MNRVCVIPGGAIGVAIFRSSTTTTGICAAWKPHRLSASLKISWKELAQALKSGDLTAARKAYNELVALGRKELGRDNPFLAAFRARDFNNLGGDLLRGDLDSARQALAALHIAFLTPPKPTASIAPDAVVKLSTSGT